MKHFPKAKGRVRNILVSSVVGYETFPPFTMKTLQQGMQGKKWAAPNLLDIKVKSTFELKACLETTIWSFLRTFMRNLQLIVQKICRLNWLKFSMRSQQNVTRNIALFQRPERASHTKVVLLCHNCNHHDRVWFQFQFILIILIKTYSLRSLVKI